MSRPRFLTEPGAAVIGVCCEVYELVRFLMNSISIASF